MSKINDVVSWTMKEDKILKLEKINKTYDISDEVAKFLESKDLFNKLDDQIVEVEIDESIASKDEEGTSGLITRLTLSDGKAKTETKEESKKDEMSFDGTSSDAESLVIKELTVGGVSVDKSGVIFKEEENIWYTLDSTINAQKFKDECTKKVVEVTIAPQEKGNDIIKGYILKEEEKKEESKDKTENTFKNGKDDFYRIKTLENQVRYLKEEKSESFEVQASVNSANQTVSGMVNPDSKPDFVLKLIERIAEHNFAIMQKLKTKKE